MIYTYTKIKSRVSKLSQNCLQFWEKSVIHTASTLKHHICNSLHIHLWNNLLCAKWEGVKHCQIRPPPSNICSMNIIYCSGKMAPFQSIKICFNYPLNSPLAQLGVSAKRMMVKQKLLKSQRFRHKIADFSLILRQNQE